MSLPKLKHSLVQHACFLYSCLYGRLMTGPHMLLSCSDHDQTGQIISPDLLYQFLSHKFLAEQESFHTASPEAQFSGCGDSISELTKKVNPIPSPPIRGVILSICAKILKFLQTFELCQEKKKKLRGEGVPCKIEKIY